MTQSRDTQISLDDTPFYHCYVRCVRRAFLCGDDHCSGGNYDHRKQWIVSGLRFLSYIYAIDICAYAVMSNHYHVVLHVDHERTQDWTQREGADAAGLKSSESDSEHAQYSFQLVADQDPNLALAGLRIEIEKKLVELAQSRGLIADNGKHSIGALLWRLDQARLLSQAERSALSDMIGLLNSAVHGAKVDAGAADWAIGYGPELLSSLDVRLR